MIQTKEELFIAELGGNPQQEIELSYGAKIKITDLLSKYLEAINYTHCCKSDSEQWNIANVNKSVAKQYAEFCVRCDREGLSLLELDDYIKQYCLQR